MEEGTTAFILPRQSSDVDFQKATCNFSKLSTEASMCPGV